MFPLTSCVHRGVKFRAAAAAAAAGRPLFDKQKVWREGWAFWGPLENNHRRVAFCNCIYLSVLSPTARCVESILGARPVATALWGIDLATWDTRGITCNMTSAARRSTLVPHPGPLPALLS